MLEKLIILFITTIFLTSDSICQNHKTLIKLDKICFFDAQKRAVVDSMINKVATVTRKFDYIILVIDNKRYLSCNIPITTKAKRILISGYVLQTFETEKIIAIPLKVIQAESL